MSNSPITDRRGVDRAPEDTGWESKVLARVSGRLQERTKLGVVADEPTLGWESTVLDTLRKRIEQESK
jgi:hypothetical protein